MITPSSRDVTTTPHTTQSESGDSVRYYLSTSQIKQLTASGRRMIIALPVPPSDDHPLGFPGEWTSFEWTAWARDSIEQFGELVQYAKPVCVAVAFKQGKQGLEGFFGQICTEAEPIDRPVDDDGKYIMQTGWRTVDTVGARQMLTVRTVVCLCHLIPPNCRKPPLPGADGGYFRIQWPGAAKRGEQRWPEAGEESGKRKSESREAAAGPAGEPTSEIEAAFWKRKARELAQALNCHRQAIHEDTRDLLDLVLQATR